MKKQLFNLTLDAILIFSFYQMWVAGNNGFENVALFMCWFLGLASLLSSFSDKQTPYEKDLWFYWHIATDIFFVLAAVYFGWIVTAVVMALGFLFYRSARMNAGKKSKKETAK